MTLEAQYSLQRIPLEERPRERFQRLGPEALTTAELIALILGSGTKSMPILQLAQEILATFGSLRQVSEASLEELCQIRGMGVAKALQLKAALSLGVRSAKEEIPMRYRILHPTHAYHLVKEELEHEKRELFLAILQDAKGYVIGRHLVAIGTLTSAFIHPREVFHPAIRHKAASLILVHNHPSGDPEPSQEDFEVTKSLIAAGRLMGIPVHDHVIVGLQSFVSLRQRGNLEF